MSAVPSIGSPDADLARRLQQTTPLENRVVSLEGAVSSHEFTLGGHDLRLDGHDGYLANHEGRISFLEAGGPSGDHETRIDALEVAVPALDVRLDVVEPLVASHTATLSTHGSRITDAEADIVVHGVMLALLTGKLKIVTTEAELIAALAIGGLIIVGNNIDVTASVVPSVGNTILMGFGNPDGTKIRIKWPYSFGVARKVITVTANDVTILNLRITTDNPLTETTTQDIGISIDAGTTSTVSRLKVMFCDIYNVATPIERGQFFTAEPPSATAAVAKDIKILGNWVHDFTYSGLFIATNTPGIVIEDNKIRGRDQSLTHSPIRNGIWLGTNAHRARIIGNEISTVGAHGIEYWNSQVDALTADGNDMCIIDGNFIHDLLMLPGGSFGISAFGSGPLHIVNNIVKTASVGIEVYNDRVNRGRLHVHNNHVEDISGQGISLNGVTNASIGINYIKDVYSNHGMQIINGCRDVKIFRNTFVNAGLWPIYINNQALAVSAVELVNDGWITLTLPMMTGRFVFEQQIMFYGLGGSVELNDEFFTISEFDFPNQRFRIGYDMSSGVSAFTSGGTVRETYRRIVVDDNEFHFTDPAHPANGYAVILSDLQDSIVTNNKSFVLDSLDPEVGTFKIQGVAARVHNGSANVTSLPAGTPANIGGSNIRMAWKAPLT